jgi:hypothetical protein
MTHEEFVRAYREGSVRLHVDGVAAARMVSARALLPLVLLPVLGLGVALALSGHVVAGIILFLLALALRWLVRASSRGFVVTRALQDAAFFEEMTASGVLRIETAT